MALTKCLLLIILVLPFMLVGAKDTLFNGDGLGPNQYLQNGAYKFIMQGDCNLVLYKTNKAIWNSNTVGHGGFCYLLLQNDGNMVMFSKNSNIIWASGSNRGDNTYRLVVQSDGNVVIYGAGGAIWATNTNGRKNVTKTKINVDPLV